MGNRVRENRARENRARENRARENRARENRAELWNIVIGIFAKCPASLASLGRNKSILRGRSLSRLRRLTLLKLQSYSN